MNGHYGDIHNNKSSYRQDFWKIMSILGIEMSHCLAPIDSVIFYERLNAVNKNKLLERNYVDLITDARKLRFPNNLVNNQAAAEIQDCWHRFYNWQRVIVLTDYLIEDMLSHIYRLLIKKGKSD